MSAPKINGPIGKSRRYHAESDHPSHQEPSFLNRLTETGVVDAFACHTFRSSPAEVLEDAESRVRHMARSGENDLQVIRAFTEDDSRGDLWQV